MLASHNIIAMLSQEGRTGILEELLEIAKDVKNFPGDYECIVKSNYYIFAENPIKLRSSLSDCGDELLKYQTGVQAAIINAFAQKVYGNYDEALQEIFSAMETSKMEGGGFNYIIGELYLLNKDYNNAEIYLNKFLKPIPLTNCPRQFSKNLSGPR